MTTKTKRQTQRERAYFDRVRRSERLYSMRLRRIARHVGHIVSGFAPDSRDELLNDQQLGRLTELLDRYAALLKPWAESTAGRILADVAKRDAKAWRNLSESMGISLRKEINEAPTGQVLRDALERQVDLITSLPREAAQRVHNLTLEARATGRRASDIADEIAETGDVTMSRATLIARTEVARTSSELTAVRAEQVGSEGYIWRTSRDGDVRKAHKEMEGKYVPWDTAPTLSDGTTTHAGCIYNCRCYPEPVLPDVIE